MLKIDLSNKGAILRGLSNKKGVKVSDQRLSKLQSWIINRAIENFNRDIEKWGKSNLNFKRPFIYRTDIYIDYFKCKDFKNIPQKLRVSTSRSLNRLEERD